MRLDRTRKTTKARGSSRLLRALEKWSGWVYAYRTFWVDPGAEWDEEKVAAFLGSDGYLLP
jgi:hypothetical protein